MTALPGHDSRYDPATEQLRTDPYAPEPGGTWVMQSDAAARTGFSVSAIRKWRRMGLVADRKVTSPSGLERVEVKLEDVLARAAQQPDRRRAEVGSEEAHTAPGSVVITLEDLETLFERMVTAERRAVEAETVVEALRDQATYTFGQLAELRRQLQESAPEPPAPVRGNAVVEPVPRPVVAPPEPPPVAPTRSSVDELGDRLRRIYARLDEYRRQAVLSPDAQRRHQRELAEYDRALVAACDAFGIPTGLGPGDPVGAEDRAALTRALARVGLDVRAGVAADGVRKPRIAAKRRF